MQSYTSQLQSVEALKAKLDQYRPLPPHMVAQLRAYYRVGLTYSSNALEGNSLTEIETKVVLEDGLTIGGKPLRDHLEASGHALAYDYLQDIVQAQPTGVPDQALIQKLHQLFYAPIDAAQAGIYRSVAIIITGTEFIPPAPDKIAAEMATLELEIPQWQSTLHPVEYAARVHYELARIHPFIDGNGRTARLLMNIVLLQAGYTITIIPPVVRVDYLALLNNAHQDIQPFIHFISHQVYESMKDTLRIVKALR